MKSKLNVLGVLLVSVFVFFACSKDEDKPMPQPTEKVVKFADANFKKVLLENTELNTNKDNEIQEKEALAFTGQINVSGKGLTNLTDLQFFPNITELDCSNNNLTALNLSKNTKLTAVYCQHNKIKGAGTTTETKGQTDENKIWTLSANTELKILDCSYNQLVNINLSKNTKLENVDCSHNIELVSLNVANGNNAVLKTLNATNTPKLKTILVDEDKAQNPPKEWKKDEETTYNNAPKEDDNAIVNIPDANFKKALLEHGKTIVDNPQQAVAMSKSLERVEKFIDKNYFIANKEAQIQTRATAEPSKISVIDTNGDGEIQVGEAKAYTGKIKVTTTKDTPENEKIVDLTGIEAFVNLKELDCRGQEYKDEKTEEWIFPGIISKIDISKNTKLEYLNCGGNQITILDISKNIFLKKLYCYKNKIEKVDATANTELKSLSVGRQPNLNTLILPKSTNLEFLNYSNSPKVANVDISRYTQLKGLNCRGNKLNSIDVSRFKKLYYLNVSNNEISTLDIAQNKELEEFDCGTNNLTSLDISQNTKLRYFACDDNSLTNLDISNNTELVRLYCYNNKLENIIIAEAPRLNIFNCSKNQLTSLDISTCTADVCMVYCFQNPSLSCIKVNSKQFELFNNPSIGFLFKDKETNVSKYCNGGDWLPENQSYIEFTTEKSVGETIEIKLEAFEKEYVWIDLNANGKRDDGEAIKDFDKRVEFTVNSRTMRVYGEVYRFVCSSNELLKLDVSKNNYLKNLECSGNNLTKLDVSQNSKLEYLSCAGNKLTSLDFRKNTNLGAVFCGGNQLVDLDITQNSELEELHCSYNKLTSLDVSKCSKLGIRQVGGYHTYFDCRENPNLKCIKVSQEQLDNTNKNWKKDDTATYSIDCK